MGVPLPMYVLSRYVTHIGIHLGILYQVIFLTSTEYIGSRYLPIILSSVESVACPPIFSLLLTR